MDQHHDATLPENMVKFLNESLRVARSRVQAEWMVRKQLTTLPDVEDFIVVAQQFAIDPNTFSPVELRKALVETALPKSWTKIDELYTNQTIPSPAIVTMNALVYPVIRVSEYDIVKDMEPQIMWHRGQQQTVTRKWSVLPEHTHLLNRGMAFIELRSPVEEQTTKVDNIEYHACIVGFCVEIKDLQL